MSIDYSKTRDEEHVRYFVELPVLGWYETDQSEYQDIARKAVPPGAWERVPEPDSFSSNGINGYRVTSRNKKMPPESYRSMRFPMDEGQPEQPVVPPRVERRGSHVALVFPEGSYTDTMGVADDDFEVLLSEAQYRALVKAETPVNLENIAAKVKAKPVPEDSIRGVLRDGLVDALEGVAKDMRDGVKREGPVKAAGAKLRAVRDLLK